ncbi:MAG: hypothetical protein M1490_05360 [Candidatus Bathyarchaeota archaeon]|nr:hypothetical protein [Candidatus Bathyarchaeota archaeon]
MSSKSSWREITLKDILLSVTIPLIIALVIIALPLSEPILMQVEPALVGIFVYNLAEVILLAAVPMFLGLFVNRWAGGVAGFICGSVYALWWIGYANTPKITHDISLLGYLVSAMLIGYIAGALNKRSFSLSKMLVSTLIAGLVGSLFLFLTYQVSPLHMVIGGFGLFTTVTPRIVIGIIVPLLVRASLRLHKPKIENTLTSPH